MLGRFVLIIIAGIFAELYVLIQIGGAIGAFPTLLLSIVTAIIGIGITQMQLARVLQSLQAKAVQQEPIGVDVANAALLVLAGLCLAIPGFITDAIGAALLTPLRSALVDEMQGFLTRQRAQGGFQTGNQDRQASGTVVDAPYFEDVTDDDQPSSNKGLPPKD